MSKSLTVVSGEASETESEDDNVTPKLSPRRMTSSIQGAVITGEDSESDTENDTVSSAASVLSPTTDTPKDNEMQFNTLLHKKLRETNKQVYKDISGFTSSVICKARESLNSTEQDLLHSQLTLQSALTSLKTLNVNSQAIKNKLESILSASFLSNIATK